MIIKQGIIVSLTVFNLQAAECRCKSWFVWKWCSAETATLLFSRQAFLVLVYKYYFFLTKLILCNIEQNWAIFGDFDLVADQ